MEEGGATGSGRVTVRGKLRGAQCRTCRWMSSDAIRDSKSRILALLLLGQRIQCLKRRAMPPQHHVRRRYEFISHPLFRQKLGMHSYVCDPSAPWQKGAVENNNERIRRVLPANTNVATLSESDLRAICNRMNQTPRKCLNYRTPEDVFRESLLELAV